VKGVGEPCAGEPHARFDGRGLETERTSVTAPAPDPTNLLFVDWLEFSGAELDPNDSKQVAASAAVELEASRRDPYRQLSRVFHLIGRRAEAEAG